MGHYFLNTKYLTNSYRGSEACAKFGSTQDQDLRRGPLTKECRKDHYDQQIQVDIDPNPQKWIRISLGHPQINLIPKSRFVHYTT